MEWDQVFEPAITLDQDMASVQTRRQLIWGLSSFGSVGVKFSIASSAPRFDIAYGVICHMSDVPDAMLPIPAAAPIVEDVMDIYGDYTVTGEEYIILAHADLGNLIIYLPPVATVDELELQIKKVDATSHRVWIRAYADEKIDNKNQQALKQQDAVLGIVADADGGLWRIL
jgi:hypothetical protein